MSNVTEKKKTNKFLFDLNIFDEDFEEEVQEEDVPPPPPTFSEEELEAARREGYERGRKDALEESARSREQYVASQLEEITRKLPALFEAERQRERRYEDEAVIVATLAFRKTFPALNARHGLDEVLAVIRDTLRGLEGRKKIVIEVATDAADGVDERLADIASGMALDIEIRGAGDLSDGGCRLRWEDGGAVRDADSIARAIEDRIQTTLSARGTGLPAPKNGIEGEDRATREPTDPDSNDGENDE